MTVDVTIIGGGPNGLMLACELALAGVRPLVLERLTERSVEPKANGLVGQVVRLLHQRGLYEHSTGSASPRPTPWFFFGAMPLNLSDLDPNPMYLLPLPQQQLEKLLEERAEELGVEIRRGHELIALSQDPGGVTLDIRGPAGRYPLRSRYVAACDGGRSTVRKQVGIDFPGTKAPDFVSRTAHATVTDSQRILESGELDVPGFGRIRTPFTRTETGVFIWIVLQTGKPVVGTVEWDRAPADDVPMTLEELQDSIRRVLGVELPLSPLTTPGPRLLRRLTGQNTRLAEHYRRGRVLLVGDAAHVHAGIGGPGLNLGLQDAVNLGWKLAAEIHGWAPPELLDTYHSERHPVGRRVFMHSQAQMALMAPGPEVTALRELFGEMLQHGNTIRYIADLMAGADVRYPMGHRVADTPDDESVHPLVGRFVPQLSLTQDGARTRFAAGLHAARPILLTLANHAELSKVAQRWSDRMDCVPAECADSAEGALLVRPDGYVAWAATRDDPVERAASTLYQALTTWFGAPNQA